MKALRIHGPLDMRLDEVETPVPGRGEVLIKVAAAGICATDIELYDGSMPYIRQGLTRLPLIPGHEWSGVVAAVGDNVENIRTGDWVVGDISIGCSWCRNCLKGNYHLCDNRAELGVINKEGSFAEYLKTAARFVYKVPEEISLEEAVFVEPAATCINAIERTEVSLGERAVVFGDGVIGFLAAESALCAGASKVALIARKPNHKTVARALGLEFIDSSREDIFQTARDILGDLPEVVIEATGNPDVFNDSVYMVKPGGKLSALSITGEASFPVDIDYVVTRDIKIQGTLASPNAFEPTLRLMKEGKIQVKPLISKCFTLEEGIEAFEYVRLRKGPRIKVLVMITKT